MWYYLSIQKFGSLKFYLGQSKGKEILSHAISSQNGFKYKKGEYITMKLKKLICVFLCCLLFSTYSTAFAADDSSNVTLGELQETLLAYLNDNGVDVTIGSEEFFAFISDQLIEGTDKKLAGLAEYPLIHAYMAAYKVAAENVISTVGISSLCDVEDAATGTDLAFYLQSEFLEKTIQDCRNEVIEQSNQKNFDSYNITPYSYYNASAAISYARRYARDPNTNSYPYFGSDCTNFVSQCLYAGGMDMDGRPKQVGHENTTTKWYCELFGEWHGNYQYFDYGYSTTWTVAGDFYTYWSRYANAGRATNLRTVISNTSAGSVVQLEDPQTGILYHTIIITRNSGGVAEYCAHSRERLDENLNIIDDTANDFRYINF